MEKCKHLKDQMWECSQSEPNWAQREEGGREGGREGEKEKERERERERDSVMGNSNRDMGH
jgi:hypothetical protein